MASDLNGVTLNVGDHVSFSGVIQSIEGNNLWVMPDVTMVIDDNGDNVTTQDASVVDMVANQVLKIA